LKQIKCPFGFSSINGGTNVMTTSITRGTHQVSFRPRRQTEKSSFSESNTANTLPSSPLAGVALRKISKFSSSNKTQPVEKQNLPSPVISLNNTFQYNKNSFPESQFHKLIKREKFLSESSVFIVEPGGINPPLTNHAGILIDHKSKSTSMLFDVMKTG